MTVGQRIKESRKNAGLTQKALAEKCGLATGTIQQYELSKREPRTDQLKKIADALNVSINYLKGWQNDDIVNEIAYWGIGKIMAHSKEERKIIENCHKLNTLGQKKALEQVELLTEIPKYQKKDE